jgi:hypothetical protein
MNKKRATDYNCYSILVKKCFCSFNFFKIKLRDYQLITSIQNHWKLLNSTVVIWRSREHPKCNWVVYAEGQVDNFSAMSWWEQVTFWWDDFCFLLDQHVKSDFYSISLLKQQSTVLDHWNKGLQLEMSLYSDTLFFFKSLWFYSFMLRVHRRSNKYQFSFHLAAIM